MKHIVIVSIKYLFICLIFSASVYPQNVYNNFMKEFYLDRSPSAKAISMGGGLVAYPEYEFSFWYNPATVGLSEPITTNLSYASADEKKYYYDMEASYNSGKFGAFGISKIFLESSYRNGIPDDIRIWIYDLYTLNYAYQPFKSFFAGINLNLLSIDNIQTSTKTIYPIDLGILKIFQFRDSKHISQKLTLGSSIYNIMNVKVENHFTKESYPLPVILRLGTSYNFLYKTKIKTGEMNLINFIGQIELEKLLNSGYYTTYKAGAGITIADAFSVRIGYFNRNVSFGSDFTTNQHQFNYGAGIKIPFIFLAEELMPFSMRFDYSFCPQPEVDTFEFSFRWEKPF